ncbi:MAG: PD-(D/E)XK nuclease family protein [Candidatus Diapherotrites archaeon]|nr:PD-(D/E)XK nuclease family protein [Candidatus Diapherotrites archaeon]
MFDFDQMVSRFLVRETRLKTAGRYYPSEIGNCLRKVWYSYKHPLEVDPEKLKIFEVGNILHGFVVEVLKSEKNKEVELLKSEFPLRIEAQGFVVSGRVDDLVLVKESGKSMVVEVKSTKSVDYVQKADPKHLMQLQLYMHATGIHNGVVLYIDKTDLRSKVFPEEYSPEKAKEIMQRFAELHKLLSAGLLPLPEAKKSADMQWMCRYCEYAEKCDKNEG